jgi:putative transcriptional regulator
MSATHHPNDELLLAHATGTAGEALSLIVGTHLALCPECRGKTARMETMGGAILSDLAPAALSDNALQSVLARLDSAPPERRAPRDESRVFAAPEPLRSYLKGDLDLVRWQTVGPGISYRNLFRDREASAKLIRSRPGRGVGAHTHGGEELTLVLTGGFTDATGHYRRGDLQTADGTLEHRPLADPGEDCIVLAVCDAPLKFRSAAVGLLGKLFGF